MMKARLVSLLSVLAARAGAADLALAILVLAIGVAVRFSIGDALIVTGVVLLAPHVLPYLTRRR